LLLSLFGWLVLNTAILQYFYQVKRNQTARTPLFLIFSMLVSSGFSLWELSLFNSQQGLLTQAVVVSIALYNLSTSLLFGYFLTNKATPLGEITVKVGDMMPAFSTVRFDSSELSGKRSLIKFYRGAWCPYCSAELLMLDRLRPKLDKYGVFIIGVSNDTASAQVNHKIRDGLSFTLVCDESLAVIRQFGVEHHKALGATESDTIMILGVAMPLPWKMKFRSMAIPTTLLIDEFGKIVWLDQSTDYRLRASESRIMAAVTEHF